MKEEVRQILKQAVDAPKKLGDLAFDFFGKKQGIELTLPRTEPHEPIEFK